MATQAPLHLFPPISQVEKRREELDSLIKKSMDMRPARPFIKDRYAPVARRSASRSRTRTPICHVEQSPIQQNQSPNAEPTVAQTLEQPCTQLQEQPIAVAQLYSPPQQATLELIQRQSPTVEPVSILSAQSHTPPESGLAQAFQAMSVTNTAHRIPHRMESTRSQSRGRRPPRESIQPPDFNPDVIKTDPLPAPPAVPPIDTQSLKRSISRTPPSKYRPRRSSSARGHGRMSNSSVMTRSSGADLSAASSHPSSTFSTYLATIESPVTNPSVYNESLFGSRPPSKTTEDIRTQSYVRSQRSAFVPPPTRHVPIIDSTMSQPPPIPPRSLSRQSQRSNYTIASLPPREMSSRASYRPQDHLEERPRQMSYDSYQHQQQQHLSQHQSPVFTRAHTMHDELNSPESFYMSEKSIPANVMEKSIQSMFPQYNHSVPLQQQSYYPQKPPSVLPFATLAHDHKMSVSSGSSIQSPSTSSVNYGEISTLQELGSLWKASNGQITAALPGPFNLKMFKGNVKAKRQTKITFGPSENETFYSIAQAHPSPGDEDEPHEALIFRHQTANNEADDESKDDLLPISHMLVNTPPAPTSSKFTRHAEQQAQQAASQITTVTPVLATLHALENASKSPQAHALSITDPRAESPAAAALAEKAVRAATLRESCSLSWIRTSPLSGKYELHHPSLGVFTVRVDGDVKSALSSISSNTKARKHAAISLMNPYASILHNGSGTAHMSQTMSPTFGHNGSPNPEDRKPEQGLLARLDFTEEQLYIDGPTIQSLGNMYLLDVCVSTIIAVALAESQRPDDHGLNFAAPPPSLMLVKAKKNRIFSSSSNPGVVPVGEIDKKKQVPAVSTVSLIKLVRNGAKKDGKKTIDWSRANAIMGVEHLTDVDDLPRITRGILSVLGAGFRSALWLLEFGVRISAKMVIGLSRFADRS